jgi:hypothetical protein
MTASHVWARLFERCNANVPHETLCKTVALATVNGDSKAALERIEYFVPTYNQALVKQLLESAATFAPGRPGLRPE